MKRIAAALLTAFALLTLTACAVDEAARWNAIKAKHDAEAARENRLAEQEARADTAMLTLAGTDAQTKANAQSYFQMKGIMSVAFRGGQGPNSQGSDASMYAPTPDRFLQYASVFAAPIASITQGYWNYKQNTAANEFNYLSNVSSNAMWSDITTTGFNQMGNVATQGLTTTGSVAGQAITTTGSVAGQAITTTGSVAGQAINKP